MTALFKTVAKLYARTHLVAGATSELPTIQVEYG
jgi:hypothetical protein